MNFLCIFYELLMSLRSAQEVWGVRGIRKWKLVARGAVETAYDCSPNFASAGEDPVKF